MGRKRAQFADVTTSRGAFDRLETRCPNCKRPIGPQDAPTFVRSFADAPANLATMRCGRCRAMLTIRFEDDSGSTQAREVG
jgi:phage FluMu protein Com